MKTLAKIALFGLLILLAVPLVKYRTLKPCKMLQKERVERLRDGLEQAGDDVRGAVGEHSERAERIVEDVEAALVGVTDGLAERVAELEVDDMSATECAAELWKMRTHD